MRMRMTSDDPRYIASHLNIFFTQDGEGYVRSGGSDNQDIEMMEWIQAAAKNIGAELCSKGGDGLCDELYDNLQYGIEIPEGMIAYLYLAVLPDGGYTDKDGENALKSAMHTCFCYNNPVTRYIADAVVEKLTRESEEKER